MLFHVCAGAGWRAGLSPGEPGLRRPAARPHGHGRGWVDVTPSFSAKAAMIGLCPFVAFFNASSMENQPALSTSGNSAVLPERGGHSIANILLLSRAGSKSPSHPQATIVFPPACLCAPRSRNWPSAASGLLQKFPLGGGQQVFAPSASPFGMDHAPSYLLPPERTARVHEQDLRAARTLAKERFPRLFGHSILPVRSATGGRTGPRRR